MLILRRLQPDKHNIFFFRHSTPFSLKKTVKNDIILVHNYIILLLKEYVIKLPLYTSTAAY